MSMDDALNLLLVHADDHRPALDGGLDGDAARDPDAPAPEDEQAGYLWNEGGDQGDLAQQRWGVVAPDTDAGRRMVAAIERLIAHRSDQSGRRLDPIFVRPGMSESETQVWRKTTFESSVSDPEDLPRYQLILGDLDGVSLAFQQVMGGDAYVGRLALDPLPGRDDPFEAYQAYVDKLLRWERQPSAAARGRALFHTVHDGTPSTAVGFRSLVKPGLAQVGAWMDEGKLAADQVMSVGDRAIPDPQELLDIAAQDRPGVLFSLSHGEGAPRAGWSSPAEQRLGQGALSFGSEGRLRGEDIAARPFLPGGLWFMLACFGAGTPQASAYYPWLAKLKDEGRYRGKLEPLLAGLPPADGAGFIASLPKAALASEQGPLAVIGHVDLAWTYAFRDLDTGRALNRPARFMQLVRSALRQDRFGIAYRWLLRFMGRVNDEITGVYQESAGAGLDVETHRRLGHLWMLRNDLAGYVLLGDPAARLPLAAAAAAARPATPSVSSGLPGLPGFPVAAAPAAAAAAPAAPPAPAATPPPAAAAPDLPLPIDQLEEAIGAVLLGEQGVKAIARAHGIERSELDALVERYRAAGRAALGVS